MWSISCIILILVFITKGVVDLLTSKSSVIKLVSLSFVIDLDAIVLFMSIL